MKQQFQLNGIVQLLHSMIFYNKVKKIKIININKMKDLLIYDNFVELQLRKIYFRHTVYNK